MSCILCEWGIVCVGRSGVRLNHTTVYLRVGRAVRSLTDELYLLPRVALDLVEICVLHERGKKLNKPLLLIRSELAPMIAQTRASHIGKVEVPRHHRDPLA